MDEQIKKAVDRIDSFLEKQAMKPVKPAKVKKPKLVADLDMEEPSGVWTVNVGKKHKRFRNQGEGADFSDHTEWAKKHGATHFTNNWTGMKGKIDDMRYS
jgi:hypothetical protein